MTNDISVTNNQDLENVNNGKRKFSNKISKLNAIASNNFKQEGFNLKEAVKEAQNDLKALHATAGLQEMICAQILSIHSLQQTSMCMAQASEDIAGKQYFTNAAIKLSNCFTQQASLLAKIQGAAGQKIVVEHVEVHQGAQAAIGNFGGVAPSSEVRK